jgi:hypothetical protein
VDDWNLLTGVMAVVIVLLAIVAWRLYVEAAAETRCTVVVSPRAPQ